MRFEEQFNCNEILEIYHNTLIQEVKQIVERDYVKKQEIIEILADAYEKFGIAKRATDFINKELGLD